MRRVSGGGRRTARAQLLPATPTQILTDRHTQQTEMWHTSEERGEGLPKRGATGDGHHTTHGGALWHAVQHEAGLLTYPEARLVSPTPIPAANSEYPA